MLQGEVSKPITVQTLPSDPEVLEGEERFQLQLIYADNNAIILPQQSYGTVVIMADLDVSGTVSVMPMSQQVYVGQSQNGNIINGLIQLTRTAGMYGTVAVAWQISNSPGSSVFVQSQGYVTFEDLQANVTINIQVNCASC